jgi:DHA2 family multidrug resistance protein-like MFS transporter
MLLLLVTGPILLPEYRASDPRPIDIASALLSLGAVLSIIYGVKRIASAAGGAWPILSIVAGAALGATFIRRQRRVPDPLIDPRLFANRQFTGALIAYTLATFVAFGIYLFVGQYLQLVLRLSPLAAGVATLPSFAGFILGSFVAPVVARRIPPITLIVAGFVGSAAGFALLALATPDSPLGVVIAGITIYSLALSPVFVLATDIIVGSAPPERAGAASALSETGSELGGALGIGVLGSIGTAIYRHAMSNGMPAGISGVAAHAARNTIGGAIAQSGSADMDSVHALARNAFTGSMNATGWLCIAAVILVAAGLALSARRRAGGSTPSGQSSRFASAGAPL